MQCSGDFGSDFRGEILEHRAHSPDIENKLRVVMTAGCIGNRGGERHIKPPCIYSKVVVENVLMSRKLLGIFIFIALAGPILAFLFITVVCVFVTCR